MSVCCVRVSLLFTFFHLVAGIMKCFLNPMQKNRLSVTSLYHPCDMLRTNV